MVQVELKHVKKVFSEKLLGSVVAVDDFNLQIEEGECFSFLWPFRLWKNHDTAHDCRL